MIGLRELECSERIITITSLIKESINFWKEDVRPDDDQSASISWLNAELDKISDDIDSCMLDADAIQVSAVVAGYAARKVVVQRNKCSDCKELAVSDDDITEMENENNYLIRINFRAYLFSRTLKFENFQENITKNLTTISFSRNTMQQTNKQTQTVMLEQQQEMYIPIQEKWKEMQWTRML